MAYSTTTLAQLISQISYLLDDTGNVYWKVPEITYTVYEALRVWGALTNYWRTRGTFNLNPSSPYPYYDLSLCLPTLRTRTYTLGQMVQEIQYALLENPSGIAGTGMSGQVSITTILQAIQSGRDQFVLDTHLPLSIHSNFAGVPQDGMVSFPQTSAFVHRVGWQDTASGTWTNLWRQDAWAVDKANALWPTQPGTPQQYSEAENAPLQLQVSPPPQAAGTIEALTVDSMVMDLTNPATVFGVPDEWIHAIKYEALSHLLYTESQLFDPLRAEYCAKRYDQAVEFAKDARSILRLLCNGLPLNLDSLDNVDAGLPFWRNQSGPPQVAGALYDIIAVAPGIPDQPYGMAADVSQTAPLPTSGQYVQIGEEDLDHIVDYVTHSLSFKCGGNDLKSTFPKYDEFMKAVSMRKGVNSAKVQYLTPLFAQPQTEWAQRPSRAKV